jgi:murein L,D-transpeptidase YcbB/YkuD
MLNIPRVILPLLGLITSLASSGPALAQQGIATEIEHLLQTPNLVIDGRRIHAQDILQDLYADHGYAPFWVDSADIRKLIELIEKSPDHGLIPDDYGLFQLRELLAERQRSPSAEIRAEAELMLTESLIRYGYHRRLGKVKASSIDTDINFRRKAFRDQPPAKTMREILAAPSLEGFIDMAAPTGPYYRRLQAHLDRYRDLAEAGGWPVVPDGPTLRLDDDSPRVAAIRARLAVDGEQGVDSGAAPNRFDAALKGAVKTFQARHGLDADGIVGRQTLAAMNVPVEDRIDQLRISLERLRWVNQEAAPTFVAVNIASYSAAFFRDGELAWTTRAMVGKSYRQTPVFRGDIDYMEFNPTWTIPPGILRNDTLPAIKRDPAYLASKNIRVIDRDGRTVDPATVDWNRYSRGVPYTLRQDPGPKNALGTVKFIFPNKHFVFLHDTPSRELFDRPERAFSSGCIRVEDPLRLAELLLDDPEQYPRSALQDIVDSRETQRIRLRPKIPVVILYLTAALDNEGHLLFMKDVYQRDAKVLAALNGPVIIDPPNPAGP